MKCESFEGSTYGSSLFCKKCGMDIGFNPIIKNVKGRLEFYCCNDCKRGEESGI